jgi:hypothetical protein
MDKAGIAVAEYWTHLPPKAEFENKIREILSEAQERFDRRSFTFARVNLNGDIWCVQNEAMPWYPICR